MQTEVGTLCGGSNLSSEQLIFSKDYERQGMVVDIVEQLQEDAKVQKTRQGMEVTYPQSQEPNNSFEWGMVKGKSLNT